MLRDELQVIELSTKCAPADAFDQREYDVTAVERQEREQVEEREGQAEQPEHPEVGLEALRERLRGALDDADRARDLLSPGPRDEPPESGADRLRHLPGPVERETDRLRWRVTLGSRRGPEADQ